MGSAFLLYRDHTGTQRIYTLEESDYRKTLVGRDPSANITLTWDQKVSGAHAELEHVGDSFGSFWTTVFPGTGRSSTGSA